MLLIFCGGGTAGHITPALAIAEQLCREHAECQVLFIGREGGGENRLITDSGFPLLTLRVHGLRRSASPRNLYYLYQALMASRQARRLLRERRAAAVIGTGGYVTYPVIRAACRLGIPTLLHESNAAPGLVTRLLAPSCGRVLLGFPTGGRLERYGNTRLVGNPVRREFRQIDRRTARTRLGLREGERLLLSVGGSLGAAALNTAAVALMQRYTAVTPWMRHLHVAGERYYGDLSRSAPELCQPGGRCQIVPFLDDMATALHAADLVISRAGAMTVSELLTCQTPAILVPSPHVSNNHQYYNAMTLVEAGGALLMQEDALTADALCTQVQALMDDRRQLLKMRVALQRMAHPDATAAIADEVWAQANGC